VEGKSVQEQLLWERKWQVFDLYDGRVLKGIRCASLSARYESVCLDCCRLHILARFAKT
jgi:hypothetical protein